MAEDQQRKSELEWTRLFPALLDDDTLAAVVRSHALCSLRLSWRKPAPTQLLTAHRKAGYRRLARSREGREERNFATTEKEF